MRTKLFLTFLLVMFTALVSNFIFDRLITGDFEDYSLGVRDDRLYWVLASVEGSHDAGLWDEAALGRSIIFGVLMGLDLKVLDAGGSEIMTSDGALANTSAVTRRRIDSFVFTGSGHGPYDEYPLFASGMEIGTLMVRDLVSKGMLRHKEEMFKVRGRAFLFISFVIAGGGALLLSVLFSVFLTTHLRRLTEASRRVAEGDLRVRVEDGPKDEVGELISSFNQMVEALERDEAMRKHLTSNIAHELRTPLTILRSNLEAAADGVMQLDAKMVENLYEETGRLTSLVRGIEDFARAEESFFRHSEYVRVDVGQVLENMLSALRPLFDEKGVSLDLIRSDMAEPELDLDKFQIVIRNILSNALKYTSGGSVTVSFGPAGTDGFHVSVADTGPGMGAEELANVFKRFYKGRSSDGVGLGMSIARELVSLMHGDITVRSALGEGTTFKVVLPLQRAGE